MWNFRFFGGSLSNCLTPWSCFTAWIGHKSDRMVTPLAKSTSWCSTRRGDLALLEVKAGDVQFMANGMFKRYGANTEERICSSAVAVLRHPAPASKCRSQDSLAELPGLAGAFDSNLKLPRLVFRASGFWTAKTVCKWPTFC
jgi:hypothetical protein